MQRVDEGDSASTCGDTQGHSSAVVRAASRLGIVQIFPRALDVPAHAWPAQRSLTLGRHSRCGLRLDDERVSREHASLSVVGSGLRVADLNSRHGTFVNGKRVMTETLAPPGTLVRCGNTLLLVVSDCEAYATPQRLNRDFLGTPRDVLAGPALWRVWQRATHAAALQDPMLLLGESGSGKEVVARLVHAARGRPGPFIALNLAAIPPGLFESELFGHTRGAFTGASRARLGAFREAAGGVLFLDEIGDVAHDLQVKLLRAIEERRVRPVGAEKDVPCDARVISATSRDLREACKLGRFRADLYYRLSGIVIEIPPLRERPDDVLLLAIAMLRESGANAELSVEAAEALALCPWPGNVRELQNALMQARMALQQSGERSLRPDHLTLHAVPGEEPDLAMSLDSVRAAMAQASGNASRAAKLLGVSRATLYNFCGRHSLALASVRAELSSDHERREAKSN